jgi:hypothetical protein
MQLLMPVVLSAVTLTVDTVRDSIIQYDWIIYIAIVRVIISSIALYESESPPAIMVFFQGHKRTFIVYELCKHEGLAKPY